MEFISTNIFPIITALFSAILLFWSLFGNRILGIKELGCREALQMTNHKNALMLDVREDGEYKSGHVLNSRHIPLGKLGERLGELEKYRDKPVVVVCRSGNRSSRACALLNKQGFSQVYNLTGGMIAWQKSGLPQEK